jgi:hypothetical protein
MSGHPRAWRTVCCDKQALLHDVNEASLHALFYRTPADIPKRWLSWMRYICAANWAAIMELARW